MKYKKFAEIFSQILEESILKKKKEKQFQKCKGFEKTRYFFEAIHIGKNPIHRMRIIFENIDMMDNKEVYKVKI